MPETVSRVIDALPLHGYDLLMLAVLLTAAVAGAWKGMAWQVASLASLGLSFFVAMRFSPWLAPKLSQQEPWNRFLAMLVLYASTSIAIWSSFRLVSSVIDRIKLKEFDKQAGALFGLAKGVVYCLVITFFAVMLSEQARQSILRSRSGAYMALLLNRAEPVLPAEVRDVLGPYWSKFEERLDPNAPATPSAERTLSTEASAVVQEVDRALGELESTRP